MPLLIIRSIRALLVAVAFSLIGTSMIRAAAPVTFARGDVVKLTRSEMLLFKGEKFNGGAKGQEFTVFQHDVSRGLVYVPFYKDDGSLIAVSIPAAALEAGQADPWNDLLGGVEAFRDLRIDDAKRLWARAGQDAQVRPLAVAISAKAIGSFAAASQALSATGARAATARQAFGNTLRGVRDTAEQLVKLGYPSLAVPLDVGADRLSEQVFGKGAAVGGPASKINRTELEPKAAAATAASMRARQAMAVHKLIQASKFIGEGLALEPNRLDLKALKVKVDKGIADAEESYTAAESMRRFEKGAVHALTALERGLKYCADYPKLLDLRKQMQSLFEERTAPEVTTAMLSGGMSAKVLEDGRKLYTTRCTECHDLELLDSRSVGNWRTAVAGMARRANLSDAEQGRIVDYLAAAQNAMDSGKGQ